MRAGRHLVDLVRGEALEERELARKRPEVEGARERGDRSAAPARAGRVRAGDPRARRSRPAAFTARSRSASSSVTACCRFARRRGRWRDDGAEGLEARRTSRRRAPWRRRSRCRCRLPRGPSRRRCRRAAGARRRWRSPPGAGTRTSALALAQHEGAARGLAMAHHGSRLRKETADGGEQELAAPGRIQERLARPVREAREKRQRTLFRPTEELAHLRRVARHLDAALLHHRDLLLRRALAAGDDGAGVAHALAGRARWRRR